MYTKSILLASLAASAVSAKQLYPGHNQIKRDLAARQTENPSAVASAGQACLTDLASAYASMPTPPPALESWLATVAVTDPCHFTIPASISSAEEEYASSVEDWYSSNSAAIASALSECPAYSAQASAGDSGDFTDSFTDVCATATGGSGGGSNTDATTTADNTKGTDGTTTAKTTAKTTATGGGSGTTAGSGTGTTTAGGATATNAGPKDTAAVGVAALAMAGVLGVVAAL